MIYWSCMKTTSIERKQRKPRPYRWWCDSKGYHSAARMQGVQKSTYRRFGSLSQEFSKPAPDCVTTDLWIPGEKRCDVFSVTGGLLKQSARTDSVPPPAWTSDPTQAAHQRLLNPCGDSTALEPEEAEQHLRCSSALHSSLYSHFPFQWT